MDRASADPLHSTPGVYLRELLQKAVDAIAARRAVDPSAQASVVIEPAEQAGGTFRITDTGVGLTEPEVLLLGAALPACFLVAAEVRVLTRSVRGGGTVDWTGYPDGRYELRAAVEELSEPGTTVSLVPRPRMRHWLAERAVRDLAAHYGSLLPVEVTVAGSRITDGEPPWLRRYDEPSERAAALSEYAEREFGFTPFDVVDLDVPAAGLGGVAFVLPTADPAGRAGHRVYLHRMLLADGGPQLLPPWAGFARCVVDTTQLRPTASREALYEDVLLTSTRQALAAQLRNWLLRLEPAALHGFLQAHHRGVLALAREDDAVLRLLDGSWPLETNFGPQTLADLRRHDEEILYTRSVDAFRDVAAVAAVQGVTLVNSGDGGAEVLRRVAELDATVKVRELEPSELLPTVEPPEPATAQRLRAFVRVAEGVLRRQRCAVVPAEFDPPEVPALYRPADGPQGVRGSSPGRGVGAGPPQLRPQLLLNLRNPLVRTVTELSDPNLAGLGVQALYGQALLQGHQPLRPEDSVLLTRVLSGLLTRGVS